jgi:hypothetical protein
MAFNPKHQTKLQYLKRLRERYRGAVKMEACRLANRMLRHLADGDVSLAQMQNAWNMTAPEWTAKAAALQVRADKWLAFKAANAAADNEAGD